MNGGVEPRIYLHYELSEIGQAGWLRNSGTSNEKDLASSVREKQALRDCRQVGPQENHPIADIGRLIFLSCRASVGHYEFFLRNARADCILASNAARIQKRSSSISLLPTATTAPDSDRLRSRLPVTYAAATDCRIVRTCAISSVT